MSQKIDREGQISISSIYCTVYQFMHSGLTMPTVLILLRAAKKLNNMYFDLCNDTVPCIQTSFTLPSVDEKQFTVLFLCWSVPFPFNPELVVLKGKSCSLLICFISEEFWNIYTTFSYFYASNLKIHLALQSGVGHIGCKTKVGGWSEFVIQPFKKRRFAASQTIFFLEKMTQKFVCVSASSLYMTKGGWKKHLYSSTCMLPLRNSFTSLSTIFQHQVCVFWN